MCYSCTWLGVAGNGSSVIYGLCTVSFSFDLYSSYSTIIIESVDSIIESVP